MNASSRGPVSRPNTRHRKGWTGRSQNLHRTKRSSLFPAKGDKHSREVMWALLPATKWHKEKNLQRFITNTDAKPRAAQFFPVLTFNTRSGQGSAIRRRWLWLGGYGSYLQTSDSSGPAGKYGAVKTKRGGWIIASLPGSSEQRLLASWERKWIKWNFSSWWDHQSM